MAGEWKRVIVSEVCELIVDCVNKTAPVVEEVTPYKMLRTTNIKGGRIDREDCRRVTKDTFVKWTRRADVKHGDVILTREAPLGEVGYVDFTDTVFLGQRLMQYRANPALLESRFLLYSFLSKDLQNQFGAHEGSGSTVSHIRVGDCSKFELLLPPLTTQKAISAVLGALDDKIELNRRMNITLEAMARALFQSWFVDFDPVRANLDGQGFNSPRRENAAKGFESPYLHLFPDSFQDSELGHIPHGWKVCPLSEKIQLLSGGTPKTSEPSYWDGDIPWYSVRDAPSETDVWVIQTDKHVTKLGIANSAAQIFPEKTTIISARGTVGKLALTAIPMAMNQSCYGVRGITGYGDYFTYYLLREATAQLQQRTHGTVFDTITTETFKTLDCVFPPPQITSAFDEIVEPLLGQIRANLHQSRTLATLRDTLLPKLLSGELSVAGFTNTETELSIGPAWLDDDGGLSVLIAGHVFRPGEKYTILEMGWAVYLTEDTVPAEWWRQHGETRPEEEDCGEMASQSGMLVTSHPVLVALSLQAWWHRNGHLIPTAPQVKVPGFAEALEEVRQRKILNDFNAHFSGEVPGLRRWQPPSRK